MTMTLTKTRLFAGVWEGELSGAGDIEPQLSVTHEGKVIAGLELSRDGDTWRVRIPVPPELISDGVQTLLISNDQGQVLSSFALLSGEGLSHDIRAELDLVRSELEMLKQSFRRHCNEN